MIAVSGASGLVGSHVVLELLASGHHVRAQFRSRAHLDEVRQVFGYYNREADFDRVEWFEVDLLDRDRVAELVEETDALIHCAALVSFHAKDRYRLLDENPRQTRNVVNAALDVPGYRLVAFSSVAALGRDPHAIGPIDERSEWKDGPANSTYALSKFLAENEVWRGIEEGLNASILNPGIVVGPGFWNRGGSSALFGLAFRRFPFYSPGATGFVDVKDLARAALLMLEREVVGKRYVLVGANWPYKRFMEEMCAALSVPPPRRAARAYQVHAVRLFQALRERLGGPRASITRETAASAFRTSVYSSALIESELDFRFRPLEACIEEYAGYFLKK